MRSIAILLLVLTTSASALAQTPAEHPALKFAKHDLERWTAHIKVRTDAAAAAQAQLEAATQAVATAKTAQQTAIKALADAAAAITAAEQAKAAADKSLADAQAALKKTETEKKDDAVAIKSAQDVVAAATLAVETSAKSLVEAVEKKKQTEADKLSADKKITEVEPLVKPATEAKAAADKLVAAVQPQFKAVQDRLTHLSATPPVADPTAFRLIRKFTHKQPIQYCEFDAHGNFLLAGARDNFFHRFDLVSESAIAQPAHKSWLSAIHVLPSNVVLTGGHDGKLVWWNALETSPVPLRTVDAHRGFLRSLAVSPDGQWIATGGNDTLVKIWSTADGTLVKELPGHPRHVYSVAFHPSGKFLVSGDLMGGIRQWEVGPWTMVRELDAKVLTGYDKTFKADVGGTRSMDFSPDGKHLAVGGITEVSNAFAGIGAPAVVLFDWESGKQLKLLRPKENSQGSVFSVKFHPTGEFLMAAGGGNGGAVWFWKLAEEKSFFDFKLPTVAYDLALHPDTLRVAVGLYDNTLQVFDMSPKPVAPAAAAK